MILKINSAKTLIRIPKIIVNPYTINFGYIPDELYSHIPDEPFSTSPMANSLLSGSVSLKKYFKEISNQYSLSSCVANAVADAFEAQEAQKRKIDPKYIKDLSRLFLYWNARNLATPPTTDRDKGSQIRWAFYSAKLYGVPTEDVYPYISSKVNDKPGWIAYKYAIQHKIKNFYKITSVGDARIRDILKALSSGCPVVFGTKIYESFRKVNDNSIIKLNTKEKYIGRHSMVLTGYNSYKQEFELRNSWGKNWGKEGYGLIDVNYIKSSVARDFWVCTL
jgi:C1A family cysteine protease